MAAPLVELDPVALVIAHLTGDTDLDVTLGGSGRIGGTNGPPYPRILVSDPPDGGGGLTWLVTPVVQLEVLGDLDGSPGPAQLRRVMWTALLALKRLPERTFAAGQDVVTSVERRGSGRSDLPTGQQRYVATLALSIHPPAV